MDELKERLTDLLVIERAYILLIDTILDNSILSYDEKSLRIDEEAPIFSIIKAFNNDEYNNRLSELKIQAEGKRLNKEKESD